MAQYRRPGSRRKRRRQSRLVALLYRRPRPIWMLVTAHVFALGIALVLYALPHHVIPQAGVAVGITSSRASMSASNAAQPSAANAVETQAPVATQQPEADAPTPTPQAVNDTGVLAAAQSASPVAEPSSTPAVDAVGIFRVKFADYFTSGEVERTDNTYRSANVNITLSTNYNDDLQVRYHVADIYIADISCLQTAFARDQYGSGYSEWPQSFARRFQSIVTINGDYSGARKNGVIIRNGTLYRDENNINDVAVIYWDGTMKTFSPHDFDAETEMANGAYQCWNFGPLLLDEDGKALTDFNSDVTSRHPRSVIGYYEPGHYCFVAVDGRSSESKGLTMTALAQLMEYLGCKQAFNLDGGQTSILCAGTSVINDPYKDGRKCSDVIMILDRAAE